MGHRDRQSLGASGAISGVMAWWCIECHKRGAQLVIQDQKVSPILFWALYVATDLSGLLQLGVVQQLLNSYMDRLVGEKKEVEGQTDSGKKKRRSEVGYDAHLGGAMTGFLWQLPSLLLRKR